MNWNCKKGKPGQAPVVLKSLFLSAKIIDGNINLTVG